jgi:hypothetical protein
VDLDDIVAMDCEPPVDVNKRSCPTNHQALAARIAGDHPNMNNF